MFPFFSSIYSNLLSGSCGKFCVMQILEMLSHQIDKNKDYFIHHQQFNAHPIFSYSISLLMLPFLLSPYIKDKEGLSYYLCYRKMLTFVGCLDSRGIVINTDTDQRVDPKIGEICYLNCYNRLINVIYNMWYMVNFLDLRWQCPLNPNDLQKLKFVNKNQSSFNLCISKG